MKKPLDYGGMLLFMMLIFVVALLFMAGYNTITSNKTTDKDLTIEWIEENHLKYYETKSNLVDEVQHYIDSVSGQCSNLRALALIDECDANGIDLKFVLAQGELESHFGVKGIASVTNSVWNVGAFDGKGAGEIHKKYHYKHPDESIKPYISLLKDRYINDSVSTNDLLVNYVDKGGHRYASSGSYEIQLRSIYNRISNNTKIDSLLVRLKYYSIRAGL